MASTATTRLRLEKQGFGDNPDTWGTVLNAVLDRIDEAIAGATSVSTTGGTTTLTDEDYIEDESRKAILLISGTLASNATIEIPALTKLYAVSNSTSGSFTVTVKTSAGTGVVVPQGTQSIVLCDATDCFLVGVSGPASSTDNRVPRFDGTTGQVLQGSGIGIDDSDNITGVADLSLSGDITVGGTVDGRDVAADGSKLDGIESGATADQTAADIRGLGFFDTTNDGTGSGLDADLLDGQHASAFGDVSGPASSTAGNLPSFSDTSGKDLDDSGIAAADVVVASDIANMLETTDIGSTVQAYDVQLDGWSAIDPATAAITFTNTGLHLLDTNASHDLIIAPGSDLSADRTLTLTTGDADRTLTLSGNAALNQNLRTTDSPTFANMTRTGYTDIAEISTPSDPAANNARLYAFDDSGTTKLAFRDSAGAETVLGEGGGGGGSQDFQRFNSSGTWTKPTGDEYGANSVVLVRAWGGGGSGGTRGSSDSGGGGGGGAYVEGWFTLSQLGATESVTVGAGGPAQTGAGNGTAGDNTTFGSLLTAYGGGGGGQGTGGQGGGGGGGGGTLGAGSSSTSATGGNGGIPLGGAAGGPGGDSLFGGGGGANDGANAGGRSIYGGGGGGGGADSGSNGGNGGATLYGGGGGGGAGDSSTPGSGGASTFGGNGGAGGNNSNGTAGTQPGGGGGGAPSGFDSGAGGAGRVDVIVFPVAA